MMSLVSIYIFLWYQKKKEGRKEEKSKKKDVKIRQSQTY